MRDSLQNKKIRNCSSLLFTTNHYINNLDVILLNLSPGNKMDSKYEKYYGSEPVWIMKKKKKKRLKVSFGKYAFFNALFLVYDHLYFTGMTDILVHIGCLYRMRV